MRGWRSTTVGEILQLEYGKPLPDNERIEGGRYPVYGANGEKGRTDRCYYERPSIIVGRKGSAGELNLTGGGFWPLDVTYFVKLKGGIDLRFAWYLLTHLNLPSLAKGVKPGINRNEVYAIPVCVPELKEQERIVAILDEAFEGIAKAKANAERNMQDAGALFDSRLSSVFSHETSGWERLTLSELLDRGWIQDHMDGNHGGDYPRKEEFLSEGVPYIAANCIFGNKVDLAKAKYLAPERAARLRKGFAKDGDVLFAHNATVGPVAILRTSCPTVILGTSLTYYRCNPEHLKPEYLAHYMRSRGFRSQYEGAMSQMTRNQVPITKQREFFHVVPPLSAQEGVALELGQLASEVEPLTRAYEQKMAALEALKQSLLHQAFIGKL